MRTADEIFGKLLSAYWGKHIPPTEVTEYNCGGIPQDLAKHGKKAGILPEESRVLLQAWSEAEAKKQAYLAKREVDRAAEIELARNAAADGCYEPHHHVDATGKEL